MQIGTAIVMQCLCLETASQSFVAQLFNSYVRMFVVHFILPAIYMSTQLDFIEGSFMFEDLNNY